MEETKYINYHKGYKYQLTQTTEFQVNIRPDVDVKTDFVSLTTKGILTIKAGYAWDGPSGPTIDTITFMRGSLVHDALYQLMRLELIPLSEKSNADAELKRICLEDGMSKIRAWWVIKALEIFGSPATKPKNKKRLYRAPKG